MRQREQCDSQAICLKDATARLRLIDMLLAYLSMRLLVLCNTPGQCLRIGTYSGGKYVDGGGGGGT